MGAQKTLTPQENLAECFAIANLRAQHPKSLILCWLLVSQLMIPQRHLYREAANIESVLKDGDATAELKVRMTPVNGNQGKSKIGFDAVWR
jgi:hypothetical protein